ncbi:hypothetical protein [uncultured Sphingomonas sp.]|uniref:hypothetical protein n=1 Tax=uncultured Sphingomonas sp. TaxID=158754 RepID=UPI0030F86DAE
MTVFGQPRGEWRPLPQLAFDDAIALGLASYDDERREHYLAVPVEIEKREIGR